MSITTVSYDVLEDSGITYEAIGLSDTLDNYALDEILDYTYCGVYDILKRNVMLNSPDTALEAPSLLDNLNVPITFTSSNPLHWEAGEGNYTNPGGLFGRIVWLKTEGSYADVITVDNAEDYKLITSWTATKYYFTVPSLKQSWITASRAATSWSDNKTYPCLYWTGNDKGSLKYHSKYGQVGDVEFSLSYQPYIIAAAREGSYILYNLSQCENIHTWYGAREVNIYGSPNNFADGNLVSFDKSAIYSIVYSAREWFGDAGTDKDLRDYPAGNELPFNWNMGKFTELQLSQTVVGDQYLMFCSSGGSQYNAYAGIRFWTYPSVKHDSLLFWANSGLFIIADNTVYKPVITDNIVVDYTDDLSTPSDYDNYDGSTKHDSSPEPPGPGTDEDENTPVNTAGAPFAKGLVNYYALTAGSVLIDHISEALSTWDLQNTGKDLYKNLVSCKLIKPPAAIPTTGSEAFTIYGEKPQYQGADITLPVVSGNPDATFGPYTISRKFNDFRDYAPYTRVCIYLPYCGWCDLPSHVVGRSVTVKYFTDIIAATVRAVVFCGNNIVAEAAGVMGLDIPFTADAVGMKQAGVVSGLTAYAGGALQTAAGVASIVTTKGGKGIGETLSGASKLVSAYTQTAIAFNENTTEISGKNGDGCCLSGATNIIIKIIRPKYGASSTAPFVPAGFAHSVGFVSNKQVRVGNVSGLLIADNVDTSGIAGATDAERAEIKRVLETGLIVNAAPQ